MLSLLITLAGTLLSLLGLVFVAPQVRARQINGASLGAWAFRAGVMVVLAGEAIALFVRPESRLVFKLMLVSGAAIAFVGTAMLTQEAQQHGFVLERAFSWQIMWFGIAALLMAIMYIQEYVMFAGLAGSLIVERLARREAARNRLDQKAISNGTFAGQIALMILTAIMLLL
jgi:hypothetical protein